MRSLFARAHPKISLEKWNRRKQCLDFLNLIFVHWIGCLLIWVVFFSATTINKAAKSMSADEKEEFFWGKISPISNLNYRNATTTFVHGQHFYGEWCVICTWPMISNIYFRKMCFLHELRWSNYVWTWSKLGANYIKICCYKTRRQRENQAKATRARTTGIWWIGLKWGDSNNLHLK